MLVAAAFLFTTWGLVFGIDPFLAVTCHLDKKILVVGSWIHGFGVAAAAKEFEFGWYVRIFATGGPEGGMGGFRFNP
jgi:hypothetical protein